jgi:peptide/nickel transport system permease protein
MRRRLLIDYLLAIVFLCFLGFILPRLLPGDPFLAIYGEEALINIPPEIQADIRRRFALDQPWPQQFAGYASALAHLDLGWSYFFNMPVLNVMALFMPWTALLAGSSLVLSTGAGFMLGVESGWRCNRFLDRSLFASLMMIGGVPDFFAGALLLLAFAVNWPVFPLGGAITVFGGKAGIAWTLDVLSHLVLPLTSLVLVRMTMAYLLTRNSMVDLMGSRYVRTALAKGCSALQVRYRHMGRAALLPVATSAGLQLSHLFAGILMVEIVFGYPGMGTLLQRALSARDYPVLQGIILLGALTVLVVNFMVDLLYPILDPRVT